MNTATQNKTVHIPHLNDLLRKAGIGGRVLITAGLQSLGEEAVNEVLASVRSFDSFTEDNDPYGEHDFGAIQVEGRKIFWKIDYYDKSMSYGSEDPSDPEQTARVMTVMLAEEY